MEKTTWKTLAIIFFILFTLETLFIIWGVSLVTDEENKTLECYYDICSDYPDALYEGNVCYCYELGVLGDYVIAKTEVLK